MYQLRFKPMAKDYSKYLEHRARLINVFALLCGFTFTATTILVTRIPEPNNLSAQLTLLFSDILLDLFIFLLLLNMVNIFFYIGDVPEPTRTTNFISVMSVAGIGLWGFLLPFIFFLFNLSLLASVSAIIWVLVIISGIMVIWIPFEKRRRNPS